MDKKWQLILKNKSLIYSIIYKHTKYNVEDIFQDAIILIYKELCKKEYISHPVFICIVYSSVLDVVRKYCRYNKEIPLFYVHMANSEKLKKNSSKNDTVYEEAF